MKGNLRLPFKVFCRYLFYGMLAQVLFVQSIFAKDFDEQDETEITVTGTVISADDGQTLPGVNILIKGTTIGTMTDIEGKYTLKAQSTSILIFRFVSFETQEITVGNQSEINVALISDVTALNEVVVTGYQTLSQERVTGSFETISGVALQQRPTSNFIDKLEGIASGVSVTNGQVEVRGRSTILASATPLYVVDGFPLAGSTLTVNPEDIESITILKDAAAASIWGVRASNGVIVVTTKSGSKKGTVLNFSSFVSITEGVDYGKMNWLSTSEEIDLHQEFFDKGWYKNLTGEIGLGYGFNRHEQANIYRLGLAPNGEVWSDETFNAYISDLRTKDVLADWEKYMLQKPVRQTYNFSIASGGDKNDIYASMVYNNNIGQSIGNSDDRVVLNIRDEFRLNDRFIFNAGINTTFRNNTYNGTGASTATNLNAYDNLVDDFGTVQYYNRWSPWASQEREAIDGNYAYTYNHLDQRLNKDDKRQRVDLRAQFGAGIKIMEGLRFDSRFQYEIGFDNRDEFRTMDLPSHRIRINDFYVPDEVDANDIPLGYQIPIGTNYLYRRNKFYGWDWRNTVSYEKSWTNHELNIFVGGEFRKVRSDNLRSKVYGYNKQTTNYVPVNNLDFQSGTIIGWNRNILNEGAFTRNSNDDVREVSFFGNTGYTFMDKYSLTASFRVDQKNLFGSDPDFRYKPLWSVGGSWQMSKENFMNGIDFVNRLTLRTTYGISGNASNRYSPYAQATPFTQNYGSYFYELLRLQNPANDQLKWEETAIFNVAVDFAIFNNRISGSIEYYNKNSTDLLGARPLDPTNGFTNAVVNYASMTNNGVDVTIQGNIIKTNEVTWDARLLFSHNTNTVTDVVDENITPVWLAYQGALRVGQPLNNLYSFDYAGLSNAGDVMLNTAENGIVNWREYKGFEAEADLIYYGTSKAPIYGGFSTTVTFKGFDLSVNLSYKFGYKFKHYYNTGWSAYSPENTSPGNRMPDIWKTRWKEPGDELNTRIPKIAYDGVNPYNGQLEFFYDSYDADWYWQDSQDNILDGGFVKIKDIILGYALPSNVLGKTVKALRANVQLTNPFMWLANDRGIDPENPYSMAWSGLTSVTFGIRATF